MKNLILILGLAISIFACLFAITSCGGDKPTADQVDAVIVNNAISEGDCCNLLNIYTKSHNDDPEGFAEYLKSVIEDDLGYTDVTINWCTTAQSQQSAAVLPLAVDVYLDNSSSMQGYYAPKGSQNITALTNLLAGIEAKYMQSPMRGFYTQKSNNKTSLAQQDFGTLTTHITNKKLPYTDAYQLDAFMQKIAETAEVDSAHRNLSFFITDGILSGTSDEIRKDANFNLNNAPLLRNRIAKAMGQIARQGYGVAIFQFNMPFNGTYYNYRNTPKQINGERPIYVLAVGPKADVREFANEVQRGKISGFEAANSLVMASKMGKFIPMVSDGERQGNRFTLLPESESLNRGKDGQTYTANISIPLDSLPEYLRDESALRKAFIVTADGKAVDASTYRISSTHLTIPVKVPEYKAVTVVYEVDDATPEWVSASSSNRDDNIGAQMGSTFNFENLVKGIKQGLYSTTTTQLLAPHTIILDWTTGETN